MNLVGKREKVWFNDINLDKLPFSFRIESVQVSEWRWELIDYVPKKSLLKSIYPELTYNFYWYDQNDLEENLRLLEIDKIIYIKLEDSDSNENILLQDRLDVLLNMECLNLIEEMTMKNKKVYVFEVSN